MAIPTAPLGVHSEVGKLRQVLVCSPGLAHQRLTPSNCDELLFDDVLWVSQAKRDHFDFVTKMRERGVEVLEMHNLLTETLHNADAKRWLLDRKLTPNLIGLGLHHEVRAWMEELEPRRLVEYLIGGVCADDLRGTQSGDIVQMFRDYLGHSSFILPPLPNTLFTRDTTCWIYGGVTLNPMHWTGPRAGRKRCSPPPSTAFTQPSPMRISRSGTATRSRITASPHSRAAT